MSAPTIRPAYRSRVQLSLTQAQAAALVALAAAGQAGDARPVKRRPAERALARLGEALDAARQRDADKAARAEAGPAGASDQSPKQEAARPGQATKPDDAGCTPAGTPGRAGAESPREGVGGSPAGSEQLGRSGPATQTPPAPSSRAAQAFHRGGEVRAVQPPSAAAPVLAGARSRHDRGPQTLPTTGEGPGRRTAAGRPGPTGQDSPLRPAVPPPSAEPDPQRRLTAIGAVMAAAGLALLVAIVWTLVTGPGPAPCCDPAVRPLPAPTVAARRPDPPTPPDPQPWPSPGPWDPAGPRAVAR